eukprot:m.381927 g.381927  ORF g.381927 m.381927 type:complete len:335 (+) comp16717_c1_seq11:652-1656(+)
MDNEIYGEAPHLARLLRPSVMEARSDIEHELKDLLHRIPKRSLHPQIEHSDSTLWVVRGSTSLSSFEAKFSNTSDPSFLLVISALRRLIDVLVDKFKLDLVLVDFGPSAGTINKHWLGTLDCILPCCFPDFLNFSSVDGLLREVIPDVLMSRRLSLTNERTHLESYTRSFPDRKDSARKFLMRPNPPRILPLLVSCFKIWRDKVAKEFANWILALDRLVSPSAGVRDDVRALFLGAGAELDSRDGKLQVVDVGNMVLPLIQAFDSTQVKSHGIGIAVPYLDVAPGATVQHKKIAQVARSAYEQFLAFLLHDNTRRLCCQPHPDDQRHLDDAAEV